MLKENIGDAGKILSKTVEHGFYASSQSGGLLLNSEGVIEYVSEEFLLISSLNAEALLGKHISAFIGPEAFLKNLKPILNSLKDSSHALQFVCKWNCESGNRFTANFQIFRPYKDSQEFAATVKKVNSSQENIEIPTQAYLEQIIDNIDCVLWLGTYDLSQIYYISPNFEKVYENTFEEYSKNPDSFWSRVHPEDLPRVLETYDPDKAATFKNLGFRYKMKSGQWRHRAIFRFFINDKNGFPALVAGIAVDDTELYNTQKELTNKNKEFELKNLKLESTNKMLEDFTALACHDLSQPLRVFSTYTQMLKDQYLSHIDENGKYLLSGIQTAISRMKGLIQGMADLSKIQEDEKPKKACNVNEIIKQIIEPLFMSGMTPGLKLEYAQLGELEANEEHITSLLKNLIENAIKYNENIPHIKIWYKKFTSGIIYAVKDNGIGIPKEAHEKIFSLGHRLPETTKQEGTGMGLSIAEKIMTIYNGKIWLHSRPGEGSTFYLFFPS